MNHLVKMMLAGTALAVAGCAVDDPYMRTKTGAGVGAVAGAILGHQLDGKSGRFVGAALGGLAGGAVGNYMDRQQAALNQALAGQQGVGVERMQDGSLRVDIASEVSFDTGSAAIRPGFYQSLDRVSSVLGEYDQTQVLVVGHTDSVGSDAYNMDLSQRRAASVGQYLAGRGVAYQRILTDGRGEFEPRASNDTASGRQMNRRVEIFVRPIVADQQGGYQQPVGGGYAPAQPYPSGGGYANPQPIRY